IKIWLCSSICGQKGRGKSRYVEKSNNGTFPLRLEIPQERRDFTLFSPPPLRRVFFFHFFSSTKKTTPWGPVFSVFAKTTTDEPGDQLFNYRLRPSSIEYNGLWDSFIKKCGCAPARARRR